MSSRQLKEIAETFLICASVVTIVIVLWTYHPPDPRPLPASGCTVQSDGATDDLAHMPARMMAKENK